MRQNTILLAALLAVTGVLPSASVARAGGYTSGRAVNAAAKKQAARAGGAARDQEWRIYVSRDACGGQGCGWNEITHPTPWSSKPNCSCTWKAAVDSCKSLGGRLMTVKELMYTHTVECSPKQAGDTCENCYWSSNLKNAGFAWHVCFNITGTTPRPDFVTIKNKLPVRCIRN